MTRTNGFTLLEVLIASFILFAALVSLTLIYNSAALSSSKATESVKRSGQLILLMDILGQKIKAQHQASELEGSGQLHDMKYQWRAKVIKAVRPPARHFGKELIQPQHQAKVWRISVTFSDNQAPLSFSEVSW